MNNKSGKRFPPRPGATGLAVALVFGSAASAWALPTGEQVVAGQTSVGRPSAGNMVIQQGTPSAIVNWSSFSIGGGEAVRIQQPGASSVLLNRVIGNSPSDIYGQLSANGKVFLVNPNGVLFGRSASVDVGSLVASTLSISNADFLAGRYNFVGSGGAVVNHGTITAAERGTVALLGGTVRNDGTIVAKLGTAALGAGSQATLDLAGDGLSKLTISQSALDALVESGGAIVADGGQVLLSAHSLDALAASVINQRGSLRARSLIERNGRIVLDGGDSGTTLVSGSLDATGLQAGAIGGEIHVLGRQVGIVGTAVLDASGDAGGGTVLVGGDLRGRNPAVRNAESTYVGADARVRADAVSNGAGGKLIVWSNESTRVRGSLSANGGAVGGNGGMVETSGRYLDIAGARVSASAPVGAAGNWLLDPFDITISNSGTALVDPAGPVFGPAADGANVDTGVISAALSGGTDVTVTTVGGPVTGSGNITLSTVFSESGPSSPAAISKTGGGNAVLTLQAAGGIILQDDASIVATGAGTLDLVFSANGAGVGGPIVIGNGVRLLTNGGNVVFGGAPAASAPATGGGLLTPALTSNGISIGSAVIDTRVGALAGGASGNISMRGQGSNDGSGGGGAGIALRGTQLLASNGSISLIGQGGPGAMGVDIQGTLVGGESAQPASLRTESGNILVGGIGGDDLSGSSGGTAQGVLITGGTSSSQVQTSGGTITILGRGGDSIAEFAIGTGTAIGDSVSISTTGAGARIKIAGEATQTGQNGLVLSPGATVGSGATTADIVLGGAATGTGDALVLADSDGLPASITTTGAGAINLRPLGVTVSGGTVSATERSGDAIAVGDVATSGFAVGTDDLSAMSAGSRGIVIGSNAHSGLISIDSAVTLSGALALQNQGAGSAGIQINGALDIGTSTLTLASAGGISQSAAIGAGDVLIEGGAAGAVVLNNPANTVNRLQVDPPASFSFVNAGPLIIGPVSGTGFSAATDTVLTLPGGGADSVSLGNFFVQTLAGALTLNQNIRTVNPGSNITLVSAATFNNPAGATLTPGAGGVWNVWAQTWSGGNPGGLNGTAPLPNLYGCTYGDVGTCGGEGGGVTIPATGNHFFYQGRPAATLIADDKSRPFGSPNPPLTFSAGGLVNGDTASAFSASLETTATAASLPSGYPITFVAGSVVSLAGYTIGGEGGSGLFPGTLTVSLAELGPQIPLRDSSTQTSYLYERNLGLPPICAATGPTTEDRATQGDDLLAVEWSRVRQKPNLSNCVDLGQRNGCSDF